jgi:hypothetical protein
LDRNKYWREYCTHDLQYSAVIQRRFQDSEYKPRDVFFDLEIDVLSSQSTLQLTQDAKKEGESFRRIILSVLREISGWGQIRRFRT